MSFLPEKDLSTIMRDNQSKSESNSPSSMAIHEATKLSIFSDPKPQSSGILRSFQLDGVRDITEAPPIEQNSTFDSDEDSASVADLEIQESKSDDEPENEESNSQERAPSFEGISAQFETLLYIVIYSSFGCILRVFIGRLFGGDCEEGDDAPSDFFSPIFRNICVTSSGTTEQTGGALFIDLPANMAGCFLMGLITHPEANGKPLPWLRTDHSLQKDKALIEGLRVGLCGCLTTFASWNTQMVRMLDGTYTYLGPQVVTALFGYLIGLSGAVTSFLMGRLAHEWLSSFHGNDCSDDQVQLLQRSQKESVSDSGAECPAEASAEAFPRIRLFCLSSFVLLLLLGVILLGAVAYDINFYQELVLSALLAPIGAIFRWKLSDLNSVEGPISSLRWLPWGTLIANVLATLFSDLIAAVQLEYLSEMETSWVSAVLPATKTGLVGSLSTVSSLVKEMFTIEQRSRSLMYATSSLTAAMFLGLAVFSPIVRS